MIIYISGPIHENLNYKEDFATAEKYLAEKGHIVINPSLLPSGLRKEEYTKICMAMLESADTIYMIKGWKNSTEALKEHKAAVAKGYKVIRQTEENAKYTYMEDGEPEEHKSITILDKHGYIHKNAEKVYDEENGRFQYETEDKVIKNAYSWTYSEDSENIFGLRR